MCVPHIISLPELYVPIVARGFSDVLKMFYLIINEDQEIIKINYHAITQMTCCIHEKLMVASYQIHMCEGIIPL